MHSHDDQRAIQEISPEEEILNKRKVEIHSLP